MKAVTRILGFNLLSELLTLFIDLTLSISELELVKLLCSICTVGILLTLMVQCGYTLGLADKRAKAHRNATLMGIVAIIPHLFLWVLLLLSWLGVFSDGYYRFYKILEAPFLQICNLCSADVVTSTLPLWGLLLLGLLSLLPFFAVQISYHITREGKNLEKIMYK